MKKDKLVDTAIELFNKIADDFVDSDYDLGDKISINSGNYSEPNFIFNTLDQLQRIGLVCDLSKSGMGKISFLYYVKLTKFGQNLAIQENKKLNSQQITRLFSFDFPNFNNLIYTNNT